VTIWSPVNGAPCVGILLALVIGGEQEEAEMNRSKEWLVPLTGVVFFVLAVVGFVVSGEPPDPSDDSAQKIVEFYVDNKDSVMVGAVVVTIASTFLIFFFGYLRKVLRAAEGESGMLSLVAFAGAVIFALGVAIDSTLSFALAETADDIDPTAVQALSALWSNDFLPFALGVQVFLLATGLSVVLHGALPKWLGWVAILLAVIAVTPIGFVAFLGAGVWLLIVSVLLSVRARAAQTSGGQST
jgi:hypothetical protein